MRARPPASHDSWVQRPAIATWYTKIKVVVKLCYVLKSNSFIIYLALTMTPWSTMSILPLLFSPQNPCNAKNVLIKRVRVKNTSHGRTRTSEKFCRFYLKIVIHIFNILMIGRNSMWCVAQISSILPFWWQLCRAQSTSNPLWDSNRALQLQRNLGWA